MSPGLPTWTPVPEAQARPTLDSTGMEGRLLAMRTDGDSTGLYRLETWQGASLFVKQVEPERAEALLRGDAIARWLNQRGAPVIGPLPGFPIRLSDGGALSVAPFLIGERMSATPEAMELLGAALARLHAVLAEHPNRADWTRATDDHLTRLAEVRADLAAGRLRAGPDPGRLARLAADQSLDFEHSNTARQPLHGDPNPGNVLLVDDVPVFLDFEDVPHSVLPPIFDLALAVERFVLVRLHDDGEAEAAGRHLLRGYGRVGGRLEPADPTGTLHSLALRSLCVLSADARRAVATSEAEWRKFFELETQASARGAVIEAIFREAGA